MVIDYIYERMAWVCVVEYPDKAYRILTTTEPIVLAQSLCQTARTPTGKLLYFRRFCDLTNAKMHELVLTRISQTSLKATICRDNPQMGDLMQTFLLQIQ